MPNEFFIGETTLLQDIIAQPEADAPRLRYAELLQQTKIPAEQARAELICLQIDLSRVKEDHPHWPSMIGRQRELLQAHRSTWERPLRQRCRPQNRLTLRWLRSKLFSVGGVWGFRRGFVEQILAPANRFLDEDVALFGYAPIRRVAITHASEFLGLYVTESRLNHLDSLHFVGDMEHDEELLRLVASAKQAGLHIIEFRLPRLRDVFSDSETTDPVLQPTKGHASVDSQRMANAAKDRLNDLLRQPSLRILFDEPAPENTAAVLALSEWVFLGDLLKREGVWAVAMSYHDTPDEDRRCRRLLLLRQPASEELRRSPYFHAELS